MKGGEKAMSSTFQELQQQRDKLLEMPITFQDAYSHTEKFESIAAQLLQVDFKINEFQNQIER